MKFDWLKTRQTKYTGYTTAYILVFLAILAAANFLANRHDKSYDSTANKRYSLSDQTIRLVRNLKNDVTITDYDETSRFEQARDLLDRYNNLSTKLTVQYIDPDKKPQLARAAGITSLGTIVLTSGTKREEARSLSEQEVTSALIRLLKTGVRTVCFVSGSGEHSLDESGSRGYSQLKDLLEKNNYKTQTISLLQNPEIPKECTIVVVGGPRYDYVERSVDSLKKFVEDGGSALFMLDPPLQAGSDKISPNDQLLAMLAGWGVTLAEGPGSGHQRRRQLFPAWAGSAAGGALRHAPDRQYDEGDGDGLRHRPLDENGKQGQGDGRAVVFHHRQQLRRQRSLQPADSSGPLEGGKRAFHARRGRHLQHRQG